MEQTQGVKGLQLEISTPPLERRRSVGAISPIVAKKILEIVDENKHQSLQVGGHHSAMPKLPKCLSVRKFKKHHEQKEKSAPSVSFPELLKMTHELQNNSKRRFAIHGSELRIRNFSGKHLKQEDHKVMGIVLEIIERCIADSEFVNIKNFDKRMAYYLKSRTSILQALSNLSNSVWGGKVIEKVKSTSMAIENLKKMIGQISPIPTKEKAIQALWASNNTTYRFHFLRGAEWVDISCVDVFEQMHQRFERIIREKKFTSVHFDQVFSMLSYFKQWATLFRVVSVRKNQKILEVLKLLNGSFKKYLGGASKETQIEIKEELKEIAKILGEDFQNKHMKIQYTKKKVFSESALTIRLIREGKITIKGEKYALAVRHFVSDLKTIQGSRMKIIGLQEFTCLAWADKEKNKLMSPNILAFIEQTTNLSEYVSLEILVKETNPLQRAQVMGFWIDVALGCAQSGNFNSSMAIFVGLNMAEILRLKKTQIALSKDHQERFKELEEMFSFEKSHENYRREQKKFKKMACVPVFQIFLSDLAFTHEGNPNKYEKCAPNYSKIQLIARMLNEFEETRDKINIKTNVSTDLCVAIENKKYDAKSLYELSLKLEPRLS